MSPRQLCALPDFIKTRAASDVVFCQITLALVVLATFLAVRTNGRAYAAVLRPSSVVCIVAKR